MAACGKLGVIGAHTKRFMEPSIKILMGSEKNFQFE
jgi:hypothetical protein